MDLLVVLPVLASLLIIAAAYYIKRISQRKPPSRVVSRKPAPTKLNVQMLYGSQTGTAEAFARQLADEAQLYGLKAKAFDLEDFDADTLTKPDCPLTIFLMATYGEGDPTDNAVEFMKWLSDENAMPDDLSSLTYTVFGLGNRQYEHFNSTGRTTDTLLTKRGARTVFPLGVGDDDKDIEADFQSWKEDLWPVVCLQLGVEYKVLASARVRPGSKWTLHTHTQSHVEERFHPNPSTNEYDQAHPFKAFVSVNQELYTSDRSCRHIELTSDVDFHYHTGDHLGVLPENPSHAVNELAHRLHLDLSHVISLTTSDTNSKLPFNGRMSVNDVLTRCIDLTCTVSSAVVSVLAQFAEGPEQAELERMGSRDGKDVYHAVIADPMLTFVEVLEKYKSIKMSLVELLAVAPRLQVRYYSICSSHLAHPKSIHLCVAVVSFDKPGGRHHKGVCSSYLQLTTPSVDGLRVFVRKSTFHPPSNLAAPMLLIGPGTGIAPFRGFVQDRQNLLENGKGSEMGQCELYFGCRHQRSEFLYRDELEYAANSGILSKLHTAYSRDGGPKVYVQDLLRKNHTDVWKLLSSGGYVYICGLVQMSKDVVEVLHQIIKSQGGMDDAAATKYWDVLKEQGRFKTDVWT